MYEGLWSSLSGASYHLQVIPIFHTCCCLTSSSVLALNKRDFNLCQELCSYFLCYWLRWLSLYRTAVAGQRSVQASGDRGIMVFLLRRGAGDWCYSWDFHAVDCFLVGGLSNWRTWSTCSQLLLTYLRWISLIVTFVLWCVSKRLFGRTWMADKLHVSHDEMTWQSWCADLVAGRSWWRGLLAQDCCNSWTKDVKMVVFRCPLVAWQFQIPARFLAVKQGLILKWEAQNCTYLIELNVRKPLEVSVRITN
jgi:hypothetical protein